MREKMNFSMSLKAISEAEVALAKLIEAEEDPSNGRVGAIKALLDSKWRRIDKILPQLKAVELAGEDGGELNISVKVTPI
jgi:hypothetical protein